MNLHFRDLSAEPAGRLYYRLRFINYLPELRNRIFYMIPLKVLCRLPASRDRGSAGPTFFLAPQMDF